MRPAQPRGEFDARDAEAKVDAALAGLMSTNPAVDATSAAAEEAASGGLLPYGLGLGGVALVLTAGYRAWKRRR